MGSSPTWPSKHKHVSLLLEAFVIIVLMEEIKEAIKTYLHDWRDWCSHEKGFAFKDLKPMHVGWKVPDDSALGQEIASLLPHTKQGHIGTVDNRKIVLLVPNIPVEGVPILQVMQLRPGSTDPLGLDHVAFYCNEMNRLENVLKKATHKWGHQSNPGHKWISLWFGDMQREAKFFNHTSLDLGAHELSETSEAIKVA